MRICFFITFLMCVSLTTHAAGKVQINEFALWSNTYSSEEIRVIPPIVQNPDGCSDIDSYMVDTTLPLEVKSRIYGMLLAAKLSNSPITVVLDGCQSLRPKIITVFIM